MTGNRRAFWSVLLVCLTAVGAFALQRNSGLTMLRAITPDAHQLIKSQQMPDGLVCTIEKSVHLQETVTGELKVWLSEDQEPLLLERGGVDANTLIFSGLNTDKPVVRGNIWEVALRVVSRQRAGEILYLRDASTTGSGEVLYTIYRKKKVVIESLQTDLTPLQPEALATGTMAIGKCK